MADPSISWTYSEEDLQTKHAHHSRSHDSIRFSCCPLQEDWLGTKDEIGSSNVHLDSSNLHLDLALQELILVTAPKLQEDWMGTQGISISLCLLSL